MCFTGDLKRNKEGRNNDKNEDFCILFSIGYVQTTGCPNYREHDVFHAIYDSLSDFNSLKSLVF